MNYQQAASYWEQKDALAQPMDRELLWTEMERFILGHNTCALATGWGDFVRCTPIEYTFKDGKFWMLSEGGLKFLALEKNPQVCIAIYDSYTGFQQLGGMQVSGVAELVEPWSAEYEELLTFKKLAVENLKKHPFTMHLLKITPSRIDFLWSGFKKLGFEPRQHLIFQ